IHPNAATSAVTSTCPQSRQARALISAVPLDGASSAGTMGRPAPKLKNVPALRSVELQRGQVDIRASSVGELVEALPSVLRPRPRPNVGCLPSRAGRSLRTYQGGAAAGSAGAMDGVLRKPTDRT